MVSRTVGRFTVRKGTGNSWEIWAQAQDGNIMIRLVHHLPQQIALASCAELVKILTPLNEAFHPDPLRPEPSEPVEPSTP